MGIRFLCPSCGHKLNVKAFLAGKRGMCPRCGSGLDIPLESQIQKGGGPVDDAPIDDLTPPEDKSHPIALGGSGGSDSHPIQQHASALPPIAHPSTGPNDASPKAASPVAVAKIPTVAPAVAPTVPTSAPVVVATPTAAPAPALPSHSVAPAQPSTPTASAATPVQPGVVDPFDDAPDAVWYVRPPSGGQYGPARGEVMRKWIGEGRVSADSMVWREGWDDWRNGAEVFPYLRSAATPPVPAPSAYAPSAPIVPATSSRSSQAVRRRSSMALAVTTVVVLGLMSIALLVTLVLVIKK